MKDNFIKKTCFDDISFDDIPQALAYAIKKIESIESLVNETKSSHPEEDKWFNLQELRQYHPDHPAAATVYGWVNQRLIPFHKHGKKLMFLKSEIDIWIKSSRRKTIAELEAEANKHSSVKGGSL